MSAHLESRAVITVARSARRSRRCRSRASAPCRGRGRVALCGVRGGMRNASPALQGQRGPVLDLHPHRPGDDVADLLAGVRVPAGRDAGRDLGEHLDDVPAGDRGGDVLDLGALERAGEVASRGCAVVVASVVMVGPLVGVGWRWSCASSVEQFVGDLLGLVLDEEVARLEAAAGDRPGPGPPDVEHVAVEARKRAVRAPQHQERALDVAARRGRRRRARGRCPRRRGSPRRSPPRCRGSSSRSPVGAHQLGRIPVGRAGRARASRTWWSKNAPGSPAMRSLGQRRGLGEEGPVPVDERESRVGSSPHLAGGHHVEHRDRGRPRSGWSSAIR